MDNISDIMNNINTTDLNNFFTNTKAKFEVVSNIKETKVDYTWLNVLEDTLPNIDKIVRNPRRFIIQEEDVVIVEKIKRVSLDTIKHLAQHSENIQDLDNNGDIVPKKLLNIQKEDTLDLYENRFIYTLVTRLETFIQRQLENLGIIANKEIKKEANYTAETIFDNKKINIELKLKEYDDIKLDKEHNFKNRILSCYEIISGFRTTEMIKSLIGCSPVSNPIRKTNLILKQPDFQKAYILWEYLDNFEFKDPKIINYETIKDSSKELEDEFTLAYYVNFNALEENKDNLMKYNNIDAKLDKLINEYIYEENQNIEEFTLKTKEKYEKALLDKQKRKNDIILIYSNFMNEHYKILKDLEEC